MPKLSRQAKENIAWGTAALLLLLLIARSRKASTDETIEDGGMNILPAQPDVSTLPAQPVQEPVKTEQPAIQPDPVYVKAPDVVYPIYQEPIQEEIIQDYYELPSKITYKPPVAYGGGGYDFSGNVDAMQYV